MTGPGRRGVFPGSFNPPTVAHLAIAAAARDHHRLGRVDLVISRVALGKESAAGPGPDERAAVLQQVAERLGWLGVVVSEHRLVADLAQGYDVVVMGADKWEQVNDPAFYGGSPAARDAALARLPTVAVVPRAGAVTPPEHALPVGEEHLDVSSTLARAGRADLMLPEALESGLW